VDELRKSVRKQKLRDVIVQSAMYNDTNEAFDYDEDENDDSEVECEETNFNENREIVKCSIDLLSCSGDGKFGTISNAWREGNTPVQRSKQSKAIVGTISVNEIEDVDTRTSLTEECSTSTTITTTPVNSTPGKRSFLQKACTFLDNACHDSPKEQQLSSSRQDSGNDEDVPRAKDEDIKNKSSSSLLSKLFNGNKKEKGDSLKKKQSLTRNTTSNELPNYMKPTLAKSKKERKNSKGEGKLTKDQKETNVEEVDPNAIKLKPLEHGDVSREISRSQSVQPAHTDLSREPLSHDLIQACTERTQEEAEQLLLVFKRVSLDDALDDNVRHELLTQLSEAAVRTSDTLSLLFSQEHIATAATLSRDQISAKENRCQRQPSSNHFQEFDDGLETEGLR